jgi:hypothetical protein
MTRYRSAFDPRAKYMASLTCGLAIAVEYRYDLPGSKPDIIDAVRARLDQKKPVAKWKIITMARTLAPAAIETNNKS